MIELTMQDPDHEPHTIYVNALHVLSIDTDPFVISADYRTRVTLTEGTTYWVKETPLDIRAQVQAWLPDPGGH